MSASAHRLGIDLDRIAARRDHGDRLRYMAGCRCLPCRAANSRYETERLAARKAGDWNGIVSAARARRHLERLARRNVGTKAVAAASDIPRSSLYAIITGKKQRIRKRTETRILEVTADARADHSLVPAGPTWKRIDWLIRQGLSKAEISRRLGNNGRALQLGKTYVRARTASAVERLISQMHLGE